MRCRGNRSNRTGTTQRVDSLEELPGRVEDDDGDLSRAEDGQFVRFLEEAILSLGEGDGSIPVVDDRRD